MNIKSKTLDIVAITSSIICAIHCAAIPIVISFSSLSSLRFLTNPYVEWSFISLAIVFVLVSLWPSYKNSHGKTKPLFLALIGFIFIALGRIEITELCEVITTVVGALLVSAAHFFNWRLLKTKDTTHQH
jgi:hypothetical protein